MVLYDTSKARRDLNSGHVRREFVSLFISRFSAKWWRRKERKTSGVKNLKRKGYHRIRIFKDSEKGKENKAGEGGKQVLYFWDSHLVDALIALGLSLMFFSVRLFRKLVLVSNQRWSRTKRSYSGWLLLLLLLLLPVNGRSCAWPPSKRLIKIMTPTGRRRGKNERE